MSSDILKKQEEKYVLNEVEKMTAAIEKDGYDGEWFLRAYDAFGNKIGSKEYEEGKIFIESRGFCVMAGVGKDNGTVDGNIVSSDKEICNVTVNM